MKGKARDITGKVNVLEMKIWMLKNNLTGRQIAKGYGCSEPVVSDFLRGGRSSTGLVKYLLEKGCPEEYFNKGRVAA